MGKRHPAIDYEELASRPGARVLGINLAALAPANGPAAPVEPVTPAPKVGKYKNQRTEYAGLWYQSKAEAKRAEYLDGLLAAGVVDWWLRQVKFHLGVVECVYVVDFLVSERGQVRAEDVKGAETDKFRRDRHLWEGHGRMPLWVIKGDQVEVIIPKGGR